MFAIVGSAQFPRDDIHKEYPGSSLSLPKKSTSDVDIRYRVRSGCLEQGKRPRGGTKLPTHMPNQPPRLSSHGRPFSCTSSRTEYLRPRNNLYAVNLRHCLEPRRDMGEANELRRHCLSFCICFVSAYHDVPHRPATHQPFRTPIVHVPLGDHLGWNLPQLSKLLEHEGILRGYERDACPPSLSA